MHPLRTIATATAVECCLLSALLSGLGLLGLFGNELDAVNALAPLTLAMAATGMALSFRWLEVGRARRLCLALGAGAIAYNGSLLASDFVVSDRGQPPPAPIRYRILSVDLSTDNYIPHFAIDAVLRQPADAVLLQDWNDGAAGQVERLARVYPQSTHCGGASVRIFVKTKITDQGCGLNAAPDAPGMAWLTTQGPGGAPLTLASVHLGWTVSSDRQADNRKAMAAVLKALPTGSTIVAGNFDLLPWTAAMRAEDTALAPLRRCSLIWPTWPARLNLLGRGAVPPILPIDHIYAGPGWTSVRLSRVRVPGSSHYAMAADLARGDLGADSGT